MTLEEQATTFVAELEKRIVKHVTGHPYLAYHGIDQDLAEGIETLLEAERRRCVAWANHYFVQCDKNRAEAEADGKKEKAEIWKGMGYAMHWILEKIFTGATLPDPIDAEEPPSDPSPSTAPGTPG